MRVFAIQHIFGTESAVLAAHSQAIRSAPKTGITNASANQDFIGMQLLKNAF
jgi:hypothetical protein